MPEKKKTAAAAPAVEVPAAEAKESKTRKSAKAPALWEKSCPFSRSSRISTIISLVSVVAGFPMLRLSFCRFYERSKQYNVTDIIDRAKADYRATHKVGVQSCKVYVKPEEDAAYYVINKVSGKLEL